MRIEDQTCTLEQAKRLKELGVKQDSIFCYCHVSTSHEDSVIDILPTKWNLKDLPDLATTHIADAFTVAELGEMLSKVEYEAWGNNAFMTWYTYMPYGWYCGFRNSKKIERNHTGYETEVHARAAMLIYLLENNFAKP